MVNDAAAATAYEVLDRVEAIAAELRDLIAAATDSRDEEYVEGLQVLVDVVDGAVHDVRRLLDGRGRGGSDG